MRPWTIPLLATSLLIGVSGCNRAPRLDANHVLSDSLARAKSQDKNVLLHFSGPG